MSTETAARPVDPSWPSPQRKWAPWLIGLVVVLVVGGVLAGVLLTRGSGDRVSSQQLAELQQACAQWRTSGSAGTTPSDWCTNMIGWMSDRMDDHPGMWASPESMLATCQEWSAANPGGMSEGRRIVLCDYMVAWMQQHASQWGSWNGWMMHGPMMG